VTLYWQSAEENTVSIVYTDITLKSAVDVINAECGRAEEKDVRSLAVNALVDTGVANLVINEAVREALDLKIVGSRSVELAGGWQTCGFTEPVEVHWKNRETVCSAVVLPDSTEVLLGIVPMGGMDLAVSPSGEVAGAHGDEAVFRVPSVWFTRPKTTVREKA
jgi:clan AA aspartic protease